VVGRNPRILVLGSFPGALSLERGEYYANPRNQFFAIMEDLFSIEKDSPYQERVSALRERHVALWDVIQSCMRPGSSDNRIRNALPNDLTTFFTMNPGIRIVALNGRKAGQYSQSVSTAWNHARAVEIIILPSSSPANTRSSLEKKTLQWRKILSA
jgi:TDG/mug DNA glycosylase family protein